MIVYLLFIFLFAHSDGGSKMIMEARLDNYVQCPDKKTVWMWTNMVVKRINAKETRLYGNAEISETVNDVKFNVELYKCASKSEPDTCEYYTSLKYQSLCDKIAKKEGPWFDYWNATTLPKKCPIPPGKYSVNGVKIGMDGSFPLFDGFWKFKNKGYNEKGKLSVCFVMELNIHRRFKL